MIIIYNIFLHIAYFFALFAKPFLHKFKEREQNVSLTLNFIENLNHNNKKIWFHAASVGEFEQAKPIIEKIKEKYPNVQILCSFFSPSAYRTQKNYPFADYTFYLPIDLPKNAKRLVRKIKPDLVIFVRYELWANYLWQLKKINVPTFLINATAPNQNFFNKTFFMRKYYKFVFSLFTNIFTVNQFHTNYFNKLLRNNNIQTLSDTRFDRIIQKVEQAKSKAIFPKSLIKDKNIFVAGSIWEKDFLIIEPVIKKYNFTNNDKLTTILVPHEPKEKFLKAIETAFPDCIRLSLFLDNPIELNTGSVIIVDSVGKLLMLYSYATLAYVGGGFGVGVHSITEPAGYGIPVACGPNCFNSPDSRPMLDEGALNIVHSNNELYDWIYLITTDNFKYTSQANAAYNYVHSRAGSSEKFFSFIENYLE